MIAGIETLVGKLMEKPDLPINDELSEMNELPDDIEGGNETQIEPPDISFIERTSRFALMEQCSLKVSETYSLNNSASETTETKSEGLTDEEKAKIKEETGWSDEIIDNIANMKQYEVLKNAGLKEVEINGRKCLLHIVILLF